jgi:hypothetical protein
VRASRYGGLDKTSVQTISRLLKTSEDTSESHTKVLGLTLDTRNVSLTSTHFQYSRFRSASYGLLPLRRHLPLPPNIPHLIPIQYFVEYGINPSGTSFSISSKQSSCASSIASLFHTRPVFGPTSSNIQRSPRSNSTPTPTISLSFSARSVGMLGGRTRSGSRDRWDRSGFSGRRC